MQKERANAPFIHDARGLCFEYSRPVIFHWYTGTIKALSAALEAGHYFSVNPAMFRNKKGQPIVNHIPSDRILTETDGQFVKIGSRAAVPADVQVVEQSLSEIWQVDPAEVRQRVSAHFRRLTEPLRAAGKDHI